MSLKRFEPNLPPDYLALLENYGVTVFTAQLFEGQLANLIMALQGLGDVTVPGDANGSREKLVQMCLGPMLRILERHGIVDQEASEFLRKAQEQRNMVVHRFMLDNAIDMRNEAGRASLNDQLARIYSHIVRARTMVEEAVDQALTHLGASPDEIRQELGELRRFSDDSAGGDSYR